MKIMVNDLSFNALSYIVAMIEMPYLIWGETIGLHHASNQIVVPELDEPDCYSPFMSWKMVGPIIERNNIAANDCITALRCYVVSVFGYEVDIPDELGER